MNEEKRIQNIPPRVGEFAYYDSRRAQSLDERQTLGGDVQTWLVNGQHMACHYSSPEEYTASFVTCHGKIKDLKLVGLERR